MGGKSASYKAGMAYVQTQQQQEHQRLQEEAAAQMVNPSTYTSKKGAPKTSTNGQVLNSDDNSAGVLGNIRKTLFAGGVSSGGIFTYGKRTASFFDKLLG